MSVSGDRIGEQASRSADAVGRIRAADAVPRAESTLGGMPSAGAATMKTLDECLVAVAPLEMFSLAADVERWPELLPHYRYVRFRPRAGPVAQVEMSANRPFGPLRWPTWWVSLMEVQEVPGAAAPVIRFHHVEGITRGMEVEWSFGRAASDRETHVTVLHLWKGPSWPLVGPFAARGVIGPVFVHGIASRTLNGLAREAVRRQTTV